MDRRSSLRALGGLAALVAVGAGACTGSPETPVDPIWGKEPCAHCAMLVSEPRYAAQLTTQEGRRAYFDDIGCMVAYVRDRGVRPKRAWVRGAETGAWLEAQGARYRRGDKTPMDFGFTAYAGGDGVTFAEMEQAVKARLGGGEIHHDPR